MWKIVSVRISAVPIEKIRIPLLGFKCLHTLHCNSSLYCRFTRQVEEKMSLCVWQVGRFYVYACVAVL